jgi:hypothetical protein
MNLLNPFAHSSFRFGFRLIVAMLIGIGVLLSGCTTLRSVPLPAPGQPDQAVTVKVGDEVQVHLKSGEELVFKITAIEPDALFGTKTKNGGEVRAAFQDMAGLQVKRVDPVRTGVAIVGGVAGVLLVVLLVTAASGGIAFMPAGPS